MNYNIDYFLKIGYNMSMKTLKFIYLYLKAYNKGRKSKYSICYDKDDILIQAKPCFKNIKQFCEKNQFTPVMISENNYTIRLNRCC